LLRFELVKLPLLPVDFSLLSLKAPLYVSVLLLSCLHLVADHGATEKADGSADASARAGISSRAADDRAQASAAESSIDRAFLARRQWFRATEKPNCQNNDKKTADYFHSGLFATFSVVVRSHIPNQWLICRLPP
jgi:hypothetical protein